MPFLGVSPTQEFTSVAKQSITGDGSTSYTLNKGVSTENDLAVFVNDVRQEPGVAYTASANTITFTANLESTDSCYVLHIGRTFSSADSPGITDLAQEKVVTITTDGHIVPTANVTYDLGTSDLRFRDLYLSGSSLHLGAHEMTANATHVSMGNVATTGVMSGNAALMTSLNADELTSGTLPLARLPDDVTIVNDLTIGGDFIVNGNTTTIAANELKVEDSLIQLATNNEISDTIDIGFVGHYSNDGGTTALHTGFFRDASDERYYLFNGYEDDTFDTATPPSTIDRTANTFSLADLVVNKLGVGTTPSGADLHLDSNSSAVTFRLENSTNDNGYIQYSADGTMRFYTGAAGGSTSIRTEIDSSGRMRIGTQSAYNSYADNFVIQDDSNAGMTIATTDTTARTSIYFADGASVGADQYRGIIEYRHDSDKMYFWTNATDHNIVIDSSGRLGIGDASPSHPLEVYNSAPTGGVVAKFETGTTGAWLQLASTSNSWQIGSTTNGLEFYADSPTSQYRLALATSGNFGIGTRVPRSTLDLGQDSSGSTQISWHSSSTRSLGNIWTSLNGGRLTFGQALKGSTTTNNGYLGAYTGTWAPSAMELSYGVINLFADAAQSLTYGGAFTPTQVAKFHHNTGFTSYKTMKTEFTGNTKHLVLDNTAATAWEFYSYSDGALYINALPSGGSTATKFTLTDDGHVIVNGASYNDNRFYLTAGNSSGEGVEVGRISIGRGGTSYPHLGYNAGPTGSNGFVNKYIADKSSWIDFHDGQIRFWNDTGTTAAGAITGTERMRIDSSGNVGIGTSSTSGFGTGKALRLGTNTDGWSIVLNSASNGNSGLLQFIDLNNSNAMQLGGGTTDNFIYGYGNRSFTIYTNATEALRIDQYGQITANTWISSGEGQTLNTTTTLNSTTFYNAKRVARTPNSDRFEAIVTHSGAWTNTQYMHIVFTNSGTVPFTFDINVGRSGSERAFGKIKYECYFYWETDGDFRHFACSSVESTFSYGNFIRGLEYPTGYVADDATGTSENGSSTWNYFVVRVPISANMTGTGDIEVYFNLETQRRYGGNIYVGFV